MTKETERSAGSLIQRVSQTINANHLVAMAILGYLLALFPFNWSLHAGAGQPQWAPFLDSNLVIDIGEAVGYAIALSWGLRRRALPSSRYASAFFGLMAVGCLGIALAAGTGFAAIAWTADLLLGVGYAAAFTFWLALISQLPPKKMLIVLAGGYLANLIDYPIITDVSLNVGAFYAVIASAASFLLYAVTSSGLALPHAALDASEGPHPYWPPARLVAFCIVITFAYGFCTSSLDVGVSTIGLKIGFALPAVIIIAGLLVSYQSFSLASVYWISCPFMILGLLSTFFFDVNAMLVKILVTTALSGAHFVADLVVRVRSQELKANPLFAYALLNMLMMMFTVAGKTVEPVFSGSGLESVLIAALVLGVVLTYGLLVSNSGNSRAVDVRNALSPESVRDRALKLAQTHGLSEREISVYQLLLEDKSVTAIANELFIAPSTVRAHVSRIYGKFGVHSRPELLQKIGE